MSSGAQISECEELKSPESQEDLNLRVVDWSDFPGVQKDEWPIYAANVVHKDLHK